MDFIDHRLDVVETIKSGGYHYVTLSGIDYILYQKALDLIPVLIPSKSDQPTATLLLLVRNGQTLNTIARKKNRSLILESGRSGELSQIWLDTIDAICSLTIFRRPSDHIAPIFCTYIFKQRQHHVVH